MLLQYFSDSLISLGQKTRYGFLERYEIRVQICPLLYGSSLLKLWPNA